MSVWARWVELEKQKGWHEDLSPVTSWHPGPGKELAQSPSALARDMPESQLLVPSWAQFGKVLECWVGGTVSGLFRELARRLLLALTVPSALPPMGNSRV